MTEKPLKPETLILASNSPRRKALLRQAGLSFTAIPSSVDETAVPIAQPTDYVLTLAEAKAAEISSRYPDNWVISADTVIHVSDVVLGKPENEEASRRMLRLLSNGVHSVLAGYCVCCKGRDRSVCRVSRTEVAFRSIEEAEIDWYVKTGEPLDKAGAYAVQGLGSVFVKRIVGSYTNVVGLPLCEVVAYLMAEGAIRR